MEKEKRREEGGIYVLERAMWGKGTKPIKKTRPLSCKRFANMQGERWRWERNEGEKGSISGQREDREEEEEEEEEEKESSLDPKITMVQVPMNRSSFF